MDDNRALILFRKYNVRLFRTALRITASQDESEEIMQETLIRFIKTVDSGSVFPEDKEWSWLRTTCVRLSVDWLRNRSRFVLPEEARNLPYDDGTEDGSLWSRLGDDAFQMVVSEISSLSEEYRTILTLRLIENMDYAEIAGILAITESGVRSRYMRARRKLEERIRKITAEY
ncbi:MAG: RNA polymerase sigma factor [Candidatus Cryptobacteroides sp.]